MTFLYPFVSLGKFEKVAWLVRLSTLEGRERCVHASELNDPHADRLEPPALSLLWRAPPLLERDAVKRVLAFRHLSLPACHSSRPFVLTATPSLWRHI